MNANPARAPAKSTVAPVVERPAAWIVGGLAVLFFVAAIVSMWWSYSERGRWQVTDARLTANKVVSYSRWYGTYYRIESEYSFVANGSRYSVPHSFPEVYSSQGAADAERRRLDGQRLHRIYYDPADPNELEMDLGAARFFLFPLLLALASALLAGWILLSYVRNSFLFCGVCGEGANKMHRFCHRCGTQFPARKGKLMSEWGLALWWEQWITPKPHAKPRRHYGRVVALGMAGLACLLFGFAAWQAASRLWVMQSWKPAQADILDSRVVSSHDGAARQVFQVEAVFRHNSPAGTVAKSDFFSRDFAWIKRVSAGYTRGTSAQIWQNPADPAQVRFGAGWLALKSDGIPEALVAGVGVLLAAGLCLALWRKPLYCRSCKFRIASHHVFCPFCGKSKAA